MDNKKLIVTLRVFLVIGILIALFLLYEHFKSDASEICNFGENFNCDVVNKSPYANIDGISYLMTFYFYWDTPYVNISNSNWFVDLITSNAFLGGLTLALLLWITFRPLKEKKIKFTNLMWLRIILSFGVLYGLFLVWIQHSVLNSWCIFCLGLDLVLISSLIISFLLKEK